MGKKKDTFLDKTLQSLSREFVSQVSRPPDPAAQALGRQLALHCLSTSSKASPPSQAVFDALTQPNLHRSVPNAFFQTYISKISSEISSANNSNNLEFLESWSIQLEELYRINHRSSSHDREVLEVCVKAYVLSLQDEEDEGKMLAFYQRLQLTSTRRCLWQVTLSQPGDQWKPAFVATVLDLNIDVSEQLFCFRSCLRFIWTLVDVDVERAVDAVSWVVRCIERLVASLSNLDDSEVVERLEMAATAVLDIVEIGQILSADEGYEGSDDYTLAILSDILLPLHLHGLPSEQIGFICRALLPLVKDLTLDIVTVFKLAVLSMVSHESGPIRALLGVALCDEIHSHSIVSALATIHDDTDLKQVPPLDDYIPSSSFHILRRVREADNPLILALMNDADLSALANSETQQTAVLVFAFVLLEHEEYREKARLFVIALVDSYPHLGRHFLPVVLRDIGNRSDSIQLVSELEFLCCFVKDPHCAQPVWKIFGDILADHHAPLPTRMSVIRILPKLVTNNKRLYRRVIDVIGAGLTESPEMRLAVAATLHELAKLDLIRDVSDVIGWIQTLLTEDQSDPLQHLLIHYACMCLHELVQSQELEFAVVLQVVGKKLVGITAPDILRLPMTIVEALVLLLGDGECEADDSDDDSDKEKFHSQTSRAVDALIAIGISLTELSSEEMDDVEIVTRLRVRKNVYQVLSSYSQEALGLDQEGVKAVVSASSNDDVALTIPSSGERYVSLVRLVLEGFDDDHLMHDLYHEKSNSVVVLARKLLRLEEESIGAVLWLKQGRDSRRTGKTPSRALLGCLPSRDSVDMLVAEGSSMAVSITRMVSHNGPDLNIIRDNADASIESSDPMFLAFAVQGFLHLASEIVSSPRLEIGAVLTEIGGWFEVFVSADSMYLSLAALSIYIRPELCEDSNEAKPYVEEIFDVVYKAFKDQKMEKDDVSKISLGLIGVSAYRRGALESLDLVSTLLEQSVRGYGGQQDFGAYYGLALMSQAMGAHEKSNIDSQEIGIRICRICGFLVEELLSCFDDAGSFFNELVSSIKAGSLSGNLIDKILESDKNSIALLMTKHVIARYLFVSCALCLPALAIVDGQLLIALLYALETLEWGSGKGITLPTVLHTCERLKLLQADELDMIYAEYASFFDSRVDTDEADLVGDGLDDIFYAVNRTANRPTPHIVRELLVGNQELFDDDGCVLSLVASVSKICGFPCLGAVSFAFSPKLDATAALSDVKSIVKIATEAADLEDESKYSGMGLIMLGILSSLKNTEQASAVIELQPKEKEAPHGVIAPSSTSLSDGPDFTKLPCPQSGTVLCGLMDFLESVYGGPPVSDRDSFLGRAVMSSVEVLSLPKQFAKSFLSPVMLSTGLATTRASIDLLLSQICGRRKAAFDGRDFIAIASQLTSASSAEHVLSLYGGAETYRSFLEKLSTFGVKFPSFSLEESLLAAWKTCLRLDSDVREAVCSFLVGLRGILSSSAALSPKVTNSLRTFLLESAFSDIAELGAYQIMSPVSKEKGLVLQHFVSCIIETPLLSLDEMGFFTLKQTPYREPIKRQSLRALCSLELVRRGALFEGKRRTSELNNVSAWIASQLDAVDDDADSIRRILCVYASACNKIRPSEKADQLAALFEILLMTNGHELGVALLAVFMAFWCNHRGSDSILSLSILFCSERAVASSLAPEGLIDYFQMLLQDLANNTGAFCRREKTSVIVFNLLHRLHAKWTLKGAHRTTLYWLGRALSQCRSGLGNEDAYTTRAIASLTTFEDGRDD